MVGFASLFASGLLVSCVADIGCDATGRCLHKQPHQVLQDEVALLQVGSAKFLPDAYGGNVALASVYGTNHFECPTSITTNGAAMLLPGQGGGGFFRCASGKCIKRNFRCDGADDCDDASDEFACGHGRRPTPIADLEASFLSMKVVSGQLRALNAEKLAKIRFMRTKVDGMNASLGKDYTELDATLKPTANLSAEVEEMKAAQANLSKDMLDSDNASHTFHLQVLQGISKDREAIETSHRVNASFKTIAEDVDSLKAQSKALHMKLDSVKSVAEPVRMAKATHAGRQYTSQDKNTNALAKSFEQWEQ